MDIEIPAEEWLHLEQQKLKELGKKLTLPGDDPTNLTLLLKNFLDGMKFIFLQENKFPVDTIPKLLIDTDIPGRTRAGMYSDSEKAIVLSWSHLEHMSQRKITEVRTLISDDDVPLFKGKTPERLFLLGVEEADHARFFTTGKDPGGNDFSSTEKYDSSPIEFSGLEARLRAAKYLGMPEDSKEIFRKRIAAVKRIREIMNTERLSS